MSVPNACSSCHAGQPAAWAADRVRAWLGRDARGFQQFAEAFEAADRGRASALDRLLGVANDPAQPAFVRASALQRMGLQGQPPPAAALQSALEDPNPSVRRAALSALGALPQNVRVSLGVPLLDDLARSVRIEAAWQLAPVAAAFAGGPDREIFAKAVEDFIAAQRLVSDRPEGRATLGEFFARLGRTSDAVEEYRAAIRLGPGFPPGYVGLAELYRQTGDERQAEETLRAGVAIVPSAAGLHHALGLSLARSRRIDEAVTALGRAAELSPDEPRFAYAHAVGLHSSGRADEAVRAIEQALERHPSDRELLFALATFHRDAGRREAAIAAATRLRAEHPQDPEARALLEQLGSQ
jgi:Flp pilus assembly protein TadD